MARKLDECKNDQVFFAAFVGHYLKRCHYLRRGGAETARVFNRGTRWKHGLNMLISASLHRAEMLS